MTGKILNIVGVVWVVGALATLGYFAVRDIQILPVLQHGMAAVTLGYFAVRDIQIVPALSQGMRASRGR